MSLIPIEYRQEHHKLKITEVSIYTLIQVMCRCRSYCERKDFEELPITDYVNLCKAISEQDTQDYICHVEFPSEENGLDYPRVWRSRDWRESYERHQRLKIKAEAERQARYAFEENVKTLTHAIMRDTGLEDQEMVKPMALAIMLEKDEEKRRNKAKMFGVIL